VERKVRRRGIPGVFLDLEPHLKGGGQFGGFNFVPGTAAPWSAMARFIGRQVPAPPASKRTKGMGLRQKERCRHQQATLFISLRTTTASGLACLRLSQERPFMVTNARPLTVLSLM